MQDSNLPPWTIHAQSGEVLCNTVKDFFSLVEGVYVQLMTDNRQVKPEFVSDALEKLMIRLMRSGIRLKYGGLKSYFNKAAKNASLDHLKKHGRVDYPEEIGDYFPDHLDEGSFSEGTYAALRMAMSRLKREREADYRMIIDKDVYRLSSKVMAVKYGCTDVNIRKKCERIRLRLKGWILELLGGDDDTPTRPRGGRHKPPNKPKPPVSSSSKRSKSADNENYIPHNNDFMLICHNKLNIKYSELNLSQMSPDADAQTPHRKTYPNLYYHALISLHLSALEPEESRSSCESDVILGWSLPYATNDRVDDGRFLSKDVADMSVSFSRPLKRNGIRGSQIIGA